MIKAQPGILSEETWLARYMTFSVVNQGEIQSILEGLADFIDGENVVCGLSDVLLQTLGTNIEGLRIFPALSGGGMAVPSTPSAIWLWLRGNDRGELYHRGRQIESMLAPAFELEDVVDTFQYNTNRDLSGYEDGTENPHGQEAIEAAIVTGQGDGLDGSSFVAVQQWLHDFDRLEEMTVDERDNAIGRHISDNQEFDAPESAHVKRTAQESFTPEAFMLRRSMPWVEGAEGGLYFVAFASSFYPFEAQLNRMLGCDDNIIDGIFEFTRPVTGAYFWCPPVHEGKMDLSALGLG